MTIRNNGNKRDPKYLSSAIILFVVGILLLIVSLTGSILTVTSLNYHFKFTRTTYIVSFITLYLAFAMFRRSNEV